METKFRRNASRQRTPNDYLYILRGTEPSYSAGPNTTTVFIVLMLHNEFFEVEAKQSTDFDEEYLHVGERRQIRHRRDALDSKIEQTEVRHFSCSFLNNTLM